MGLSETLALICTIFMGHDLSDGLPTDAWMHQITFEDRGYFSEPEVKITSHYADLEGDPTPYEPDNEQVSQYVVTNKGMYIFNVPYENVYVDDETLEAEVTKANIEYVIDSKTMRFKETYTPLGNPDNEGPDINFGYCVETQEQ
tara:strand:- start:1227 stop:1658 length:432 start_codon:yes stop_codon:yes gene_type:complete